MIILTQQSGGTNTAQIRSTKESGFKILYRASCTESEAAAARTVVRKFFGKAAADTVIPVPNEQIPQHIPTGPNRRPCNPSSVWIFTPSAR